MTDILTQLDAATDDWFMIEGGKAQDIYFETSFLLDYFIKQKKGLFKRPTGGKKISVLIRYDGNQGGFFARGGILDSTKREAITKVHFAWKNVFSNGTIYWTDTLDNAGPEAYINLIDEEVSGAVETHTEIMATSLYTGLEGDVENFTGLKSATDGTATLAYGGYASNDIVSEDGTKVWTGSTNTNTVAMSMNAIRTGKTVAAYGKKKKQEPDLMVTTETNFNTIRAILEPQQRFTEMKSMSEPVKAGFNGVYFEGTDIFPDRYCPASNAFLINSAHAGFVFHKEALHSRKPWEYIAGSARDKTMKILSRGNFVCNNRRSMYRWSAIA